MKPENPFLLSDYISPDYFLNRDDEEKRMISAVKKKKTILLTALPGIGKSALIHHLFYKLSETGGFALYYFDILPSSGKTDFINILMNVIMKMRAEDPSPQRLNLQNFLDGQDPHIIIDPLVDKSAASFETAGKKSAEAVALIFEYLQRIRKKTIIAFDGFHVIKTYNDKNFESLVIRKILRSDKITFILAGIPRMEEFTGTGWKRLLRNSEQIKPGNLERDKYLGFIKRKFKEGKFTIQDESIGFILDWTHSHTYSVQYICSKLFNRNIKNLTLDHVKETILNILKENEKIYLNYRNMLTDYQWNLMKAIAKEGKIKMITARNFIDKYNLTSPSSVNTAINALIDKQLIFKNESRYHITDIFLWRWLERV